MERKEREGGKGRKGGGGTNILINNRATVNFHFIACIDQN